MVFLPTGFDQASRSHVSQQPNNLEHAQHILKVLLDGCPLDGVEVFADEGRDLFSEAAAGIVFHGLNSHAVPNADSAWRRAGS